MIELRLLADDLTGALDTAAQFVGLTGPVPVFWTEAEAAGSAAYDSGTRELGRDAAVAAAGRLAALLEPLPGRIAFKKIDSLLRGHSGAELAACVQHLAPAHCVLAPAFPFQGRVTRGGLQYTRDGAGWRRTGEDLHATLAQAGLGVTLAQPGDALPPGLSLWDAQSDADLAAIVQAGRSAVAPVLWCGSSGLAGALAGAGCAPPLPPAGRPLLGLFGSDHPVTAGQLQAAAAHALTLPDGEAASAARLAARLARDRAALVTFALPEGIGREAAAAGIARHMAALVRHIPPPHTLLVAGGETLRALCLLLHASHLEVLGQIMPGIPRATLRGGAWDGVAVIAKSGAFGAPGLLHRLVAGAVHPG